MSCALCANVLSVISVGVMDSASLVVVKMGVHPVCEFSILLLIIE
jgi:hypothetical protein